MCGDWIYLVWILFPDKSLQSMRVYRCSDVCLMNTRVRMCMLLGASGYGSKSSHKRNYVQVPAIPAIWIYIDEYSLAIICMDKTWILLGGLLDQRWRFTI